MGEQRVTDERLNAMAKLCDLVRQPGHEPNNITYRGDEARGLALDLRDCRAELARLREALKIANVQGPPVCHVCGRGHEEQDIIDAALAGGEGGENTGRTPDSLATDPAAGVAPDPTPPPSPTRADLLRLAEMAVQDGSRSVCAFLANNGPPEFIPSIIAARVLEAWERTKEDA